MASCLDCNGDYGGDGDRHRRDSKTSLGWKPIPNPACDVVNLRVEGMEGSAAGSGLRPGRKAGRGHRPLCCVQSGSVLTYPVELPAPWHVHIGSAQVLLRPRSGFGQHSGPARYFAPHGGVIALAGHAMTFLEGGCESPLLCFLHALVEIPCNGGAQNWMELVEWAMHGYIAAPIHN